MVAQFSQQAYLKKEKKMNKTSKKQTYKQSAEY